MTLSLWTPLQPCWCPKDVWAHLLSLQLLLCLGGWPVAAEQRWESLGRPARGCRPSREPRGDARHSLPSGPEPPASSWKDLLLNDISPEWNTDHLSAANDDTCLLTSQDQHSEARNLFSPLKGKCIKTKFTVNCWLLKPKAGSARYPFH